jgi:hypothetical protein
MVFCLDSLQQAVRSHSTNHLKSHFCRSGCKFILLRNVVKAKKYAKYYMDCKFTLLCM